MAGTFEAYLDSYYGAPGSVQAQAAQYERETQALETELASIAPSNNTAFFGGGDRVQSQRERELRSELARRRKGQPSIESQIAAGAQRAQQAVLGGSQGAASLIQQGYEDDFAHRVGGLTSANRLRNERLAGEAGVSGLSSNLGRRIANENDVNTLEQVGVARGDLGLQKNLDLAGLFKSTGTEIASILQGQTENAINYEAAKRGAAATKSAGNASALGALGAGLISAFG